MEPTEQQFIRALYSQWDFQQALSALTFLIEECNFEAQYNNVQLRRFRCFESQVIISLCRPFEASRSASTLSLKVFEVQLTKEQKKLLKQIQVLRKKVIAHSDVEEMHFRTTCFPVLEKQFNIPYFQFNEGLHLDRDTLVQLQELLHSLLNQFARAFFKIAQDAPHLITMYLEPQSLR